MDHYDLGSMFLLGLMGTGHCVGMCGPLVLALPASSGRTLPQMAYHAGRVLTYMAVGLVLGALAQGLSHAASASGSDALMRVARLQTVLSLLAAGLLVVLGLSRLGLIREPAVMTQAGEGSVPRLGLALARATREGGWWASFSLGLVMGLLPCGLSYAAFARALASGEAWQGALLVLAFGLGTVPGLMVLGTSASGLFRRHRRLSDVLAGVIMIGMAARLVVDSLGTVL